MRSAFTLRVILFSSADFYLYPIVNIDSIEPYSARYSRKRMGLNGFGHVRKTKKIIATN